MTKAGVSIVIPVRDRGDALAGTVGSALLQDDVDVDVDVVIVDDGSTDETSKVAAVLAFDPRVTVVTNAESVGTARSLALGVAKACHGWTAFLPAGAHFRAGACRRALETARRRRASVVRGGFTSSGTDRDGALASTRPLSIAGAFAVTDLASDALEAVPATDDGDGALSLLALCLASDGAVECPDVLVGPEGRSEDGPEDRFDEACGQAARALAGASRIISRMDGWGRHRGGYLALVDALVGPLLVELAGGEKGDEGRRFMALATAVGVPEAVGAAAGLGAASLRSLCRSVSKGPHGRPWTPTRVARTAVLCPPGAGERAARTVCALNDLAVEARAVDDAVEGALDGGARLSRARQLHRFLNEGGFDSVAVPSSPDLQTLLDTLTAFAMGLSVMVSVPPSLRPGDDKGLVPLVSLATAAGTPRPDDALAWSEAAGRTVATMGAGSLQEGWAAILDAVEGASCPMPPVAEGPLLALFDPRLNDSGQGSLPCDAEERVALLEAQVASLEARLAAARDEARALRMQLAGAGPLQGERAVPDFPPGDLS